MACVRTLSMGGDNAPKLEREFQVPGRRRLGEVLMSRGLVTEEQLQEGLARQKNASVWRPLGQILREDGIVSSRDVISALAESMAVPFVTIDPAELSADIRDVLPREFIEEHNLLPIVLTNDCLIVAAERFTDIWLADEIKRAAGRPAIVVAAEGENIRESRRALLSRSPVASGVHERGEWTRELDQVLEQLRAEELKSDGLAAGDHSNSDLVVGASSSPVVSLVQCIIRDGVELGASDIHLESVEGGGRVRYRVDGELIETVRLPERLMPPIVSRVKILADLDISERRLPQDGAITMALPKRSVDLRVSTAPMKYGEKIVMRVVDADDFAPNLDELGMDADLCRALRTLAHEGHGIVIVTGPTGSGKTTTLYGMLGEIADVRRNLCTVEDPVERRLDGANQLQVNNAANLTFATALRSLLRQDPDCMMVGEVRDAETARLATEAALTGHLVLTTLHTNDAATAIPRLVNMGVEPYLVAASLRGVLAQRLVKRLCEHCRRPTPLSGDARAVLEQVRGERNLPETVYNPVGCEKCRHTGYRGRVGVFELLVVNERMLSAILGRPGIHPDIPFSGIQPQRTLFDDALEKARDGVIDLDGVFAVISRTDELSAFGAIDCGDPDIAEAA